MRQTGPNEFYGDCLVGDVRIRHLTPDEECEQVAQMIKGVALKPGAEKAVIATLNALTVTALVFLFIGLTNHHVPMFVIGLVSSTILAVIRVGLVFTGRDE